MQSLYLTQMTAQLATTIAQSQDFSIQVKLYIEKLIHTQLKMFLNKSSVYERQFGFRSNHSTTYALLVSF